MNVNPDILKNLAKSLSSLLSQSQPSQTDQVEGDTDPDINSVLTLLLQVVTLLSNQVKSVGTGGGAQVNEAGASDRLHVDELDECRQRNFKGNLIITSQALPEKNKVCLLKTDQQLQEDGQSFTQHIIDLVKKKFDVTLPEPDIQACHRLPHNAVLLRIWNRKPGSAWSQLIEGIKLGKNTTINVFFKFSTYKKTFKLIIQNEAKEKVRGDF